ncbi:hypothetical protein, partial [Aeromonas caviae]|uniref:hypothetical protein n=1 Tax=Aeromonas caviae TaxID=648 RepID=UPI001BCE1CF9
DGFELNEGCVIDNLNHIGFIFIEQCIFYMFFLFEISEENCKRAIPPAPTKDNGPNTATEIIHTSTPNQAKPLTIL